MVGSGAVTGKKGCAQCRHNQNRSQCNSCGWSGICEHNRIRNLSKVCGVASICEQNRINCRFKPCGGSGNCQHNRQPYDGASICEHNRQRIKYKQCTCFNIGGVSVAQGPHGEGGGEKLGNKRKKEDKHKQGGLEGKEKEEAVEQK